MLLRFARPSAEPAVCSAEPVPRTSMRSHHPDARHHLAEFYTSLDEDAEPALARIAGDVALEVAIGLPPSEPLTRQHYLDNYLLSIVSALGQRRIPAAFARKHHANISTLTVAPARHRASDMPPMLQLHAVGSSDDPAWKERLTDACAGALGTGPHRGTASLDVAFVVSSLRNWTTLWKPTIDAIAGPLLGLRDLDNPWSSYDDHITQLGLHRTIQDSVGYDVVIGAWWVLHEHTEPQASRDR
jgi:hypothetical protein